MPSQSIHEIIDVALFGETYPDIHLNKDQAIRDWGPLHRIIAHEPFTNLATPFPPSAFVHDAADLLTLPLVPLALMIDPKLVLD